MSSPVEDVAAGHLLAAEKGRIGERYILGARNMTLKQILDALSAITGRPAPRVRLPHAVALAAGYADECISRLRGREPQIPVEGVKMSRHRMFVESDKAERELGYKPGPVEAALERAVRWYESHGYIRGKAASVTASARRGSLGSCIEGFWSHSRSKMSSPPGARCTKFRDGDVGQSGCVTSLKSAERTWTFFSPAWDQAGRARRFRKSPGANRTLVEFCISAGLGWRAAARLSDRSGARGRERRGVRATSRANERDDSGDPRDQPRRCVSFAADCGATVVHRFYSAERAISRADEKKHLGKSADAVEMESFDSPLRAPRAYGVPAVAIRAISDVCGRRFAARHERSLQRRGPAEHSARLGQVALHPQSIPGLVKLGQQSRRAAESLAQFLDRYIERLAAARERSN